MDLPLVAERRVKSPDPSGNALRDTTRLATVSADLERLHRSSSVYTAPMAVEALLDAAGWYRECDLAACRLLEPACGDGAILVEAVRRLFRSARDHGLGTDAEPLETCIAAFEIDAGSADVARQRVVSTLVEGGARRSVAGRLARRWVRSGDFLLQPLEANFSHAVANPPYLRWSRLAASLRKLYEAELPKHAARGDLSLAFLHRSLGLLKVGGKCAFLFPDRWLRSKYGEAFRNDLVGKASLVAHIEAHDLPVFDGARQVETYPAISVFKVGPSRGAETAFDRPGDLAALASQCRFVGAIRAITTDGAPRPAAVPKRRAGGAILWDRDAQALITDISERFPTLAEAAITVRCGIGLGLAKAFILEDPEIVEADRTIRFVRTQDIGADGDIAPSAWLANPWDADGQLVDLDAFPLLARHLEPYREALEARVCVRRPAEWYRTIDKVRPEEIAADKIIVAGLSEHARIGLSRSPCQPGNALYTLRSEDWPLPELARLLRAGVLDLFAQVLATRMRSGVKRFDGYLLSQVRVPRWEDLTATQRQAFANEAASDADIIAGTYDLDPRVVLVRLAQAHGREPEVEMRTAA